MKIVIEFHDLPENHEFSGHGGGLASISSTFERSTGHETQKVHSVLSAWLKKVKALGKIRLSYFSSVYPRKSTKAKVTT